MSITCDYNGGQHGQSLWKPVHTNGFNQIGYKQISLIVTHLNTTELTSNPYESIYNWQTFLVLDSMDSLSFD